MTREEQVTRASLLWRLKSDDDEVREIAWQEFHNCYAPTIRRFAFRLGATEEQAADVAQEVMLGFFSATPEFVYTPSRGRFRGYLKVSVCRALQRHRRRFVVATLPDEKLDDASAETGEKVDEALETYQQASEIEEEAYRRSPDSKSLHRLFSTRFMIAALYQRRDELSPALDEYQAALRLLEDSPIAETDEQLRSDMVSSLSRIGTLQVALREAELADASLRRSLDMARQLAKSAPDDATRQRNLAISGDQLGMFYLNQGRAEQALPYLQDNLKIFRQLSAVDPDNLRAKRDIAVSMTRIGDSLLSLQRYDDALTNFQDLVQHTTEIYDRYPTFENGRFQVNTVERVARVLVEAGRCEEALPHHHRVIELREQLVLDHGANPVIQGEVAFAYRKLADVLSQVDQPVEALAATEKAVSLHEELWAADADGEGNTRRLANSLAASAKLLIKLNRGQEALARLEKAVRLRRDRLQEDPADLDRQAGFAVTLARYGEGLEQLASADDDHRAEAHAAFEESLALFTAMEDELSDEEREVMVIARAGLERCEKTIGARP